MSVLATDVRDKRIDGWKAIASFFNRDRSTVMRWARDHNLPVRRMPGGKQGSVFAFESELLAWSLKSDEHEDRPMPDLARPSLAKKYAWIAGMLLAAAIAAVSLYTIYIKPPLPLRSIETAAVLPKNAKVAADYINARDLWGRRTPEDIERAIVLYKAVISRDPGFSPAYVGLAEAWLVYREYGSVDDPTAYNAARVAANRALQINIDSPGAHRALGFIYYWWDGIPALALSEFKRAISLDDRDAQSHFWYANVLADLGAYAAADREYSQARLLSPGSQTIEVEFACSKWQAGQDKEALKQLTVLAAKYPNDATIHNCLAWVHISSGDIVGFAREYRLAAVARNEPQLLRLTTALNLAVRRDPKTAHRVLIQEARSKIASGGSRLRDTPAFFAAAMGDRQELVALLIEARNLGERWHCASIRRRIATLWKGDAVVERLVRDVSP